MANKKWLIILIVVAVFSLAAAVFFGFKYSTAKKQIADLQQGTNKGNGKSDSQAEAQQLINKVGNLIILPTDEQPTVATVSDLAKLKDQPFFANAQIGDKVLIYTQARKAILYRPSTNKIIELAPLTDNPASAPNVTPQQ